MACFFAGSGLGVLHRLRSQRGSLPDKVSAEEKQAEKEKLQFDVFQND